MFDLSSEEKDGKKPISLDKINKGGRPTKYNKDLAEAMCKRISSSSLSNEKICQEFKINYDTFFEWLNKHEEFSDMYKRAKELQSHHLVDQALEIADSKIPEKDVATASMRKLAVETRLKIAEKLAPRIWGKTEKLEVDVNVKHQMTDDKFGKLLETIKAKKLEAAEQDNQTLNDEEKAEGYIEYEES